MKGLWGKILQVMKDVEYLQKDDKIDMPGTKSYKAITEEKVTGEVGKSMRKHGLIIYPMEVIEERTDLTVVRSSGKEALEHLSTVHVKYKICDPDSGEFDIISSVGTGVDTQDKAVGKAMTYAYKYALLRTFSIPTGEDPDKIASEEVTMKKSEQAERKVNQEQLDRLMAMAIDDNDRAILSKVRDTYGYKTIKDLKQLEYDKFVNDFGRAVAEARFPG